MVMKHIKEPLINRINEIDFSGSIIVKKENTEFKKSNGFANRADEIPNKLSTRFGIASGCKLFTAIGICQLVEKGLLSFESRLSECVHVDFPHFDRNITVHHLLTHTSGIPDYFDEEVMDDFSDLWKDKPMYLLENLRDFLPMFQNNKMMFNPGERFHYNNAGFIVLGLIIEHISGEKFTTYIEKNIFEPCGMKDSGYFSLDRLPKDTAIGYIDFEDSSWKTNAYSIPIKGGADGGAYITAPDMVKLWEALLNYQLLSEETTKQILTPHSLVDDEDYYGYGIWIRKKNDRIYKYFVIGYDPGVRFSSGYYPDLGMISVITSNKENGPYDLTKALEELI